MKDSTDNTRLISSLLHRLLQDGSLAIVVTLIAAPRNVGAKMIVQAKGIHHGSFEDASVDEAVIRQAAIFLASKEETRTFYGREFAPDLSDFSEAQFLFELIQPEQRVVICGAGHVGASLARLAALLGYRAALIDDRKDFVRREDFSEPNIELLLAESWSDAVRTAVGNGRGVSVCIVTRGHSEDEQCLRAVLSFSDPDYVGLIGSTRRTRIVLERLRNGGISDEQLEKVHAPIGLDIGAVTPEEVALAIIAEIVAVRRGGTGRSLSQ
ncbi:MAG TPA: XdhC/CoxI family protein [Pyrinomonadaceae bacterium]|nr:XdhC/CoxI family protein [Pyrinomonadaceae bacterium]